MVKDSLDLIFAWWSRSNSWSSKPGIFCSMKSSCRERYIMYYVYTECVKSLHKKKLVYRLDDVITRQWVIGQKCPRFSASEIGSGSPCKNQIEAIYHRSWERKMKTDSRVKKLPFSLKIFLLKYSSGSILSTKNKDSGDFLTTTKSKKWLKRCSNLPCSRL